LFLGVLLLVLRTARPSRRVFWVSAAVALIGSVGALAAMLTHTQDGEGAAYLWRGLILLITVVLIVRRVLARSTVTVQSIYGALSAYLITGLMYAAFYAAIQHLGSGDFFADRQPADTQTLQYFSFTTLTTLGYGDFTAAGNGGRALAAVEALTGQVFLATLVARLVAAFRAPGEQARAPTRRRWPPGNVRRGPGPSYRRKPPRSTRSVSPLPREPSRDRHNGPRAGGPGASS
jgi:Ion channel